MRRPQLWPVMGGMLVTLAPEDRSVTHEYLGLASLSLAAGCTDVLTFLKLGDLFTSAMTGNTALLAIAMGRGQVFAASRSLMALAGFTVGVALATIMEGMLKQRLDMRATTRRLLLLEMVFLVCCASLWSGHAASLQPVVLYAVILLSSVSMGVQSVAAAGSNVYGVNTIVFTTALVRVVSSATRATVRRGGHRASPPTAGFHVASFVAYVCGAAIAGAFVAQHLRLLIWVPVAAVVVALGLMHSPGRSD